MIAINYIKNFNNNSKLKNMIKHGIICGGDYAKNNGIEPVQLTEELKLIFEGK